MKTKPKLTKEQRRRVRELMQDEGNTRAEAVAWVLHFEPAEPDREPLKDITGCDV